MRKGSVSIVGALALLGVLAFGSQAQAQVMTFENYMAWWDTLNCDRMINVVVDTEVDTAATQDGGAKSTLGEFRWCGKWMDLAEADQKAIKDAVTMGANKITRDADDELISVAGWWRALNGRQQCIAVGRFDAGTGTATDGTACADGTTKVDNINDVNPSSVRGVAMGAGEALSGMAMPTPAVPLVGLGFLGLLLAGRGAYLRRRRA